MKSSIIDRTTVQKTWLTSKIMLYFGWKKSNGVAVPKQSHTPKSINTVHEISLVPFMYNSNSRYSLNKLIPGEQIMNKSARDLLSKEYRKKKIIVEMQGIERGTFHMQSERSTAEIQPHRYSYNCLNSLSSISFRFQRYMQYQLDWACTTSKIQLSNNVHRKRFLVNIHISLDMT